jgi:hypothetical protein
MAVLACLTAATPVVGADSEAMQAERRIKAAFLSKFVEYVEWPPMPDAPADTAFRIGVLGDDAMAAELQAMLSHRRIGNRGFEIRRLDDDGAPAGVHMLFIGRAKSAVLQTGLVRATDPILVVTDFPAGLTPGATIDFIVRDAHVRFEVSLADAERRHLKLGSGLLTVARNVRRSAE